MHVALAGTFESGYGMTGAALAQDLPPLVSGATVQPLNYNTAPE